MRRLFQPRPPLVCHLLAFLAMGLATLPAMSQGPIEELVVRQSMPDRFAYAPLGDGERPLATTLAEHLTDQPGVDFVGQGGLFQGVTVRGFSRQRLHWRVADVPIRTERRAGATLAFLDPAFVDSLTLLSPHEAQRYGSGAVGGALAANIVEPANWRLLAGLDSTGSGRRLAATGPVGRWRLGVATAEQHDEKDAAGTRLNVGYRQRSGFVKRGIDVAPGRVLELFALAARGDAIGKSNTDFPSRATDYPTDAHHLLQLSLHGDRSHGFLYLHDHDLTTHIRRADERTRLRQSSLASGLGWDRLWQLTQATTIRWDTEWHYRGNVRIDEDVFVAASLAPALSGRRLDASEHHGVTGVAMASARGSWRYEGGLFLHHFEQEGRADTFLTGSVALARAVGNGETVVELARNFRSPTLSERFFTGATGRGDTIGNARLARERVDSATARFAWDEGPAEWAVEMFVARARDLIERRSLGDDVSTFVNASRAALWGIRASGEAPVGGRWRVAFVVQTARGEDDDDAPLNNQTATRGSVALGYHAGAHKVTLRLGHRLHEDDVSTADLPLDSASTVDLLWAMQPTAKLSVSLGAYNLGDERYRLASDDKATLALGRRVALQASYSWL